MKLSNRIARLEARRPPRRPDPFAGGVLDRLSDAALGELGDLFRRHGAEYLEDMPPESQARAWEIIRAVQLENPVSAGAAG